MTTDTGLIAPECGAAPYENYNEKITAECYRPNAEAGNFERISFNLGPTLALWLEQTHPDVYARVIAAVRSTIELVRRATEVDLLPPLLADLAVAHSWRTGLTGADLYEHLPALDRIHKRAEKWKSWNAAPHTAVRAHGRQ